MSHTPDSGQMDGSVHRLPIRVYVADTDAGGMVYHGTYLNFLERGRSEFLRLLDIDHSALISSKGDPMVYAVTRLEIDYRRQAKVDDVLIIETRMVKMRGASFDVEQRISRDDELVAEAIVRVAILERSGPKAGMPGRIPAAIKEKLTPLV